VIRTKKSKKSEKEVPRLTPRQKRFVDYYCDSWDEYDAYKKAGYKGNGNGNAQWYARTLLQKPEIQWHIRNRWIDDDLDKLTPMQRKFIDEYPVDLNGKQAAIRAGYSPRSAGVLATYLLNNPTIKQVLANRERERSIRTNITVDRLLKEEECIFGLDPAEVVDEEGCVIVNLNEIPERARRAIAGIEETYTKDGERRIRVRFWDKGKALERVGRHLAMYTDNINLEATVKQMIGVLVVPAPVDADQWSSMVQNYNQEMKEVLDQERAKFGHDGKTLGPQVPELPTGTE